MAEICIDTWLYGELARFGGDEKQMSFANLVLMLPEGSLMCDLLTALKMRSDERGITFINGDLSAMPGLQPDLKHELKDGDRVAFFHLKAMWPFQYRLGAAMIGEMQQALSSREDQGLQHVYKKNEGE
jgi:hypothetical protein